MFTAVDFSTGSVFETLQEEFPVNKPYKTFKWNSLMKCVLSFETNSN